jgi:hypothetical protein
LVIQDSNESRGSPLGDISILPSLSVATETGPFATVQRLVVQFTCHAIFLGYQAVDCRRELAIHLENPFQCVLESSSPTIGSEASGRWMMQSVSNDFVQNIQISLIERFQEIATHDCRQ